MSMAVTAKATAKESPTAETIWAITSGFEKTKVWRSAWPVRRKERTNSVGTRTKSMKKNRTSEYQLDTKRLLETKARNAFRLPSGFA